MLQCSATSGGAAEALLSNGVSAHLCGSEEHGAGTLARKTRWQIAPTSA
jgi:hypothetical protein